MGNYLIFVSLFTIFAAQVIKLFSVLIFSKKLDFKLMLSTGGMPSSHTAITSSLTTSIVLIEGTNNIFFAISFIMMVIIGHDAMGIRYESGLQAEAINKVIIDLQELKKDEKVVYETLKEKLGHKPFEVIGGFLFGVIISYVMYLLFYIK